MKSVVIPILAGLFLFAGQPRCWAALPVVDGGLIATNLQSAKRDLIEQLLQEGNQRVQIGKLLEQITMLDRYLDRFGDPETVVELEGLTELLSFLREIGASKTSEAIIRDIGGEELFEVKEKGVYKPVSREIILDGEVVDEIDAEAFTPELAARRSFEHYREVRDSVLKKRSAVMSELDRALEQLRSATTASEVQKLAVVVSGLQTQIAATDSEILFAALEAQTRLHENTVEEAIQRKAEVQKDRAALRVGAEKDLGFYRLPTKPAIFKR